MNTPIRFEKHDMQQLKDRRWLLRVLFKDEAGRNFVWVPRWDDLHWLYKNAARVERLNGSKDPEGFEQVAKTIFTEQEIAAARLVYGSLDRVEDAKLVISNYADDGIHEEAYPVAFKLDPEWLDRYLHKHARCLVVNGHICKTEIDW